MKQRSYINPNPVFIHMIYKIFIMQLNYIVHNIYYKLMKYQKS